MIEALAKESQWRSVAALQQVVAQLVLWIGWSEQTIVARTTETPDMSFSLRPRLTPIHLYNNGVALAATHWMPETFNPDMFVAKWYCGRVQPEDMPQFAADALEAGYDGPALRRLAGLIRPTAMDVGELFQQSLAEIGTVKIRNSEQAAILLVRTTLGDIVDQKIDPIRGASVIAGLVHTLDYPDFLTPFLELAELSDETYMGEYAPPRAQLIKEIIEQTRKAFYHIPG